MPLALLLQVPPLSVLPNVVLAPTHTEELPLIAGTTVIALTVIFFIEMLLQVVAAFVTVYVMRVVPAATPVTSPVASTVADAGVPLVHAPPLVASVSVIVAATQTLVGPAMAVTVGRALTVIGNVW
jgi:hypothetical protein